MFKSLNLFPTVFANMSFKIVIAGSRCFTRQTSSRNSGNIIFFSYINHCRNKKNLLTKQDIQNETISSKVTLKSQENKIRKKTRKRNEVSLFRHKPNRLISYSSEIHKCLTRSY